VHTPGTKTRKRICTIDGSKCVKSDKDVPLGGFVKKISPHPQYPPNSENFALRKQFFAKTSINFGGSAAKIRIRIGNSQTAYGDFRYGVKNLTGSRILAVSAHAH